MLSRFGQVRAFGVLGFLIVAGTDGFGDSFVGSRGFELRLEGVEFGVGDVSS